MEFKEGISRLNPKEDRLNELRKKIERLSKEVEYVEEESHKIPFPEGYYWYINHPIKKELEDAEREYNLIVDFELREYRDIDQDCRMSLNEFVECCEMGGFIDDDGIGYYGTIDKVSNLIIEPSDVTSGKYRKDFDYVYWYNR